jgi:hypothetical protein
MKYGKSIAVILLSILSLYMVVWIENITLYTSLSTINVHGTNQSSSSSSSGSHTISMMERGDIAMGFNQKRIAHDFRSTPTGGEIMITALDPNDTETIEQFRNHILDIQKDFSKGNFTKPFFIQAEEVPGTKVMTEKRI